MPTIGFIGAGNMAEAIARGLLRQAVYQPADIRATDLRPLGPWLRAAITSALADEQLPRTTLGDLGVGEPLIAKTANRQLLGFMNETTFRAEVEISHAGGLSATDIAAMNHTLRRDLHNYNGRYATPLEQVTGRRR